MFKYSEDASSIRQYKEIQRCIIKLQIDSYLRSELTKHTTGHVQNSKPKIEISLIKSQVSDNR
jgi:hypothetical protein